MGTRAVRRQDSYRGGAGLRSAKRANDKARRGQLGRGTTSVLYTSSRRCFEMGSAVRTESSREPSMSSYTIVYAAHSRQGENRTAQVDTIIHKKHDSRAPDKQLHCTSAHSTVEASSNGSCGSAHPFAEPKSLDYVVGTPLSALAKRLAETYRVKLSRRQHLPPR